MRYKKLQMLLIQALLIFPFLGLPQADLKAERLGGFKITNPLAETSFVAIYDFVGQESLIGIEGAFLSHVKVPDWSLTVGGLTDLSEQDGGELRERERNFLGSGTLFFGTRYDIEIVPEIHLGFAYGRNLEESKNIAGIKTSYKFRFW